MGWVFGVHSLDPRVVRELGELSRSEFLERLKGQVGSLQAAGAETWDEIDENEGLTLLASTKHWNLEKSFEDIQQLASLAPALAPVRALLAEMEDFSASGVSDRFHPSESGLMGVAMPATIAAAREALRGFTGPSGRKALDEVPLSWHARLLSRGLRSRIKSDDHLWARWTRLAEAIEWADSRKEWLGLHMA